MNNKTGALKNKLYDKFYQKSKFDIISAIIIYAANKKIPTNTRYFQNFIYNKRKDPKYSNIFGDFVFSQNEIYPISSEIDECINMLQLGGLLILDNPRYTTFSLSDNGIDRAKERIEKIFGGEEIEELQKLGDDFNNYLMEALAE